MRLLTAGFGFGFGLGSSWHPTAFGTVLLRQYFVRNNSSGPCRVADNQIREMVQYEIYNKSVARAIDNCVSRATEWSAL